MSSISIAFPYRGATITISDDNPDGLAEKVQPGLYAARLIVDDALGETQQQQAPTPDGPSSPSCSHCGGPVEYREWTRKSDGKQFRAFKCVNSKAGETHDIEWVNG